MDSQLHYKIGITMVPFIGNVSARALVNQFGSAEAVFKAKRKNLETIEGIGQKRVESILKFNFKNVDKEIAFIQKHNIRPLFFQDPDFPQRLLHCFDSPVMLYYKGSANLNAARMVGVVGTRNPSAYGKNLVEKLVKELASDDLVIVSGLAFGVDTFAHKASLSAGIDTVGVLAHGLDRIYPVENKNVARQMITSGGLLTEFRQETIPDKQNFPSRNRIVAGMCDCVVVVESGVKGGSLITAELAIGYHRDVFAFPGRVGDTRSAGCNFLIKTNKAGLITCAGDLLYAMGWQQRKPDKPKQTELFSTLAEDDKVIFELLQQGPLHIDQLYLKSRLAGTAVAQSLLMLEMNGIIRPLPGKMYELN